MPEWTDNAIILSVRPFGEHKAIVNLLTSKYGRHAGLVHGADSRSKKGVLELANIVDVSWRGRLSEQLGSYQIELVKNPSALILDDPIKLVALASLCTAIETALPERDPQHELWESVLALIQIIELDDNPLSWLCYFVRWELNFLRIIGFGLGLEHCAVSGRTDNLIYISPKSGNAVHQDYAGGYVDRLLRFPEILKTDPQNLPDLSAIEGKDIEQGLNLTGYFLAKRVFALMDKDLPSTRLRLADLVSKLYKNK